MSEQSLRGALEQIKAELERRSDAGEAHLFLNIPYRQLEDLLAAHCAEPALFVTDETVESATIAWYEATA